MDEFVSRTEFETFQKMQDKTIDLIDKNTAANLQLLERNADSNFKLIHYTLEQILEQTKKTNGRVTKNEEEIKAIRERELICPVGQVSKDLEELYLSHKELKDETRMVRFLEGNKTLALFLFSAMVVSTVGSLLIMIFK
jgi:hypothetical protein